MRKIKRILALMLALILSIGCMPTSALAASRSSTNKITIRVRVYDASTGQEYDVGTDYATKRDKGIQSEPYQIPPLTNFTPSNTFGRVTKVAGNWYFPTGDQQVGVTVEWSNNASKVTMTYWVNWYNPNGGSGEDIIDLGGSGSKTLNFTIIYHSNYPNGTDTEVTKKYTVKSYTSDYNIFKRNLETYAKCGFSGYTPKLDEQTWYTDKSCSSVRNIQASNGGTYHCFAGWKSVTTVKLTYKDGTDVYSSMDFLAGDTVTVIDNTNEKEGYEFTGWSTTQGGSVVYEPGDTFDIENDTTLYAVWEQKSVDYTLTYDANGGEGAPAAETKSSSTGSARFTVSSVVPTRDGYKFLGWSKDRNSTVEEYIAGDTMTVTADTTLYAVWEKKQEKFTVVYSNNDSVDVPLDDETYQNGDGTFDLTALTDAKYNGSDSDDDTRFLYAGLYTDDSFTTPVAEEEACGLAVSPKNGDTLYVRLVSAKYFRPKALRVWDGEHSLTNFCAVTAVDSLDYEKIGFSIDNEYFVLEDVYNQVTLKFTDKTRVYNSQTSFGGIEGYLGLYELDLETYAEWESSIQPFFITTDGVMVMGDTIRNNTPHIVYDPEQGGNDEYTYNTASENVRYGSFSDIAAPAAMFALNLKDDIVIGGEEKDQAVITIKDGDKVSEQTFDFGNLTGQVLYEEKEDAVFAGYFMDESYTTPADFSNVTENMTVYAKYLPAGYLQVKQQTIKTKGIVTAVRMISSAERGQFAEFGFDFRVNEKESSAAAGKLYAAAGGQSAAKMFGVPKTAKVFRHDLNTKNFADGTQIEVTPYWVTLDGTKVTGLSRTLVYYADRVE